MSEQVAEKHLAFCSIKQLAERWGVSHSTINREIKRDRLKSKHIGGQIRFSAADVASYELTAI
jgi:excisionase family DNA binding protein